MRIVRTRPAPDPPRHPTVGNGPGLVARGRFHVLEPTRTGVPPRPCTAPSGRLPTHSHPHAEDIHGLAGCRLPADAPEGFALFMRGRIGTVRVSAFCPHRSNIGLAGEFPSVELPVKTMSQTALTVSGRAESTLTATTRAENVGARPSRMSGSVPTICPPRRISPSAAFISESNMHACTLRSHGMSSSIRAVTGFRPD